MAITFDNSGKPTYMFQAGATSTDGIWFAVAGKVDTAAGYEWGGTQTFLNTVTTDATVILRDGFNNFLNPAARDAALTAPVHGTLAFVRQDGSGNTINQIQYYNGSSWVANDGDISGVTAGTGLTGGGTAGTITLNVDTAVVATTNNTLTMSGKTLTSPTVSGLSLSDSSVVFEGSSADEFETTLTVTNPTADRTITLPDATGTVVLADLAQTLTNKTITTPTLTLSSTTSTTSGQIAFNASTDKIIVGDGTNAIEFAPSTLLTNAQVASYGLVLADKDRLVEMNVGSANNLTVPLNSSQPFPIGTQINILQTGAGQTTVVATGGVTINATPGLKLRAQWSSATLIKRGTDTWVLVGDLSA